MRSFHCNNRSYSRGCGNHSDTAGDWAPEQTRSGPVPSLLPSRLVPCADSLTRAHLMEAPRLQPRTQWETGPSCWKTPPPLPFSRTSACRTTGPQDTGPAPRGTAWVLRLKTTLKSRPPLPRPQLLSSPTCRRHVFTAKGTMIIQDPTLSSQSVQSPAPTPRNPSDCHPVVRIFW